MASAGTAVGEPLRVEAVYLPSPLAGGTQAQLTCAAERLGDGRPSRAGGPGCPDGACFGAAWLELLGGGRGEGPSSRGSLEGAGPEQFQGAAASVSGAGGACLTLSSASFPPPAAPPDVRVFRVSPQNTPAPVMLACVAWGFFPAHVEMSWLRNGLPVAGEPALSNNGDWTYQARLTLPVTPQRRDVYSCRVEHAALPEPITRDWGEWEGRGRLLGSREGPPPPQAPSAGLGSGARVGDPGTSVHVQSAALNSLPGVGASSVFHQIEVQDLFTATKGGGLSCWASLPPPSPYPSALSLPTWLWTDRQTHHSAWLLGAGASSRSSSLPANASSREGGGGREPAWGASWQARPSLLAGGGERWQPGPCAALVGQGLRRNPPSPKVGRPLVQTGSHPASACRAPCPTNRPD